MRKKDWRTHVRSPFARFGHWLPQSPLYTGPADRWPLCGQKRNARQESFMRSIAMWSPCRLVGAFAILSVAVCAGSARHPAWGLYPAGWPGFAWNAQHWGRPSVAAQPLTRIKWSTPVDQAPSGGAHYGTPMLTPSNMLVVPIRLSAGTFRVE